MRDRDLTPVAMIVVSLALALAFYCGMRFHELQDTVAMQAAVMEQATPVLWQAVADYESFFTEIGP